jgi:hypothetical protein
VISFTDGWGIYPASGSADDARSDDDDAYLPGTPTPAPTAPPAAITPQMIGVVVYLSFLLGELCMVIPVAIFGEAERLFNFESARTKWSVVVRVEAAVVVVVVVVAVVRRHCANHELPARRPLRVRSARSIDRRRNHRPVGAASSP